MTAPHEWLAPSSGTFSLCMSLEDAHDASHVGQCDEDVRALSERPDIAAQLAVIDADVLRAELSEYGAWDDEQLADHAQNLQRILWLAAGDIAEDALTRGR